MERARVHRLSSRGERNILVNREYLHKNIYGGAGNEHSRGD